MSTRSWQSLNLVQLLCINPVPEFSLHTKLNLQNQKLINKDVKRTRSTELSESEKEMLETLLTFYCKDTDTNYKQGMNEVLVPFILLCREGMPYNIAYTCFKEFINICLKTMFSDNSFRPLQILFILMSLLLKYHFPALSNYLKSFNISPDSYITPWLLTMYSTKVTALPVLFILWEEIVVQKDPIFPLYIGLSLLNEVGLDFEINDTAVANGKINRIKIETEDQMRRIIEKSKNLRKLVPNSVRTKLQQYDVYDLEKIDPYIEALQSNICLSILPREIMQLIYPEFKLCSCESKCGLCDISYPVIIIDCRPESEQDSGYFPNTEFLKEKYYKAPLYFINQFESIKGIYHFALMYSEQFQGLVKKLAQIFIDNNFPHISIIEGGYPSCHQLAITFKLPIKNHKKSKCRLCVCQNNVKQSAKVVSKKKEKEPEKISKVFECFSYDKKKGKSKEKLEFIISELEISVKNGEKVLRQFLIEELVSISISRESKKILIFDFPNIKESFSFESSEKARQCLDEVTNAFHSLNVN